MNCKLKLSIKDYSSYLDLLKDLIHDTKLMLFPWHDSLTIVGNVCFYPIRWFLALTFIFGYLIPASVGYFFLWLFVKRDQ